MKQRSSYSSRQSSDESLSSYQFDKSEEAPSAYHDYRITQEDEGQEEVDHSQPTEDDTSADHKSGQSSSEAQEQVHRGYVADWQDQLADTVSAAQRTPGVASQKPDFDPHVVWKTVLAELKMQLDAARYNTWMRDTCVLAYEDGEFIIGSPHAYAADWLENRMRTPNQADAPSHLSSAASMSSFGCSRCAGPNAEKEAGPLYAPPVHEEVEAARIATVGRTRD